MWCDFCLEFKTRVCNNFVIGSWLWFDEIFSKKVIFVKFQAAQETKHKMGPAADKINIIHFNDVYNIESGDKVSKKKRLIFFKKRRNWRMHVYES